jgi:predicted TPR repeat methyltransferase
MANTHLERARNHYQQGELAEALDAYLLALKDEPKSADILHAIAAIKAQLGDSEEALVYIDKALKQSPNNTSILNSKANILARQNKLDEAISTYNQAIKSDLSYAVAYNGLGKCLYQQNKLSLAEKALQKSIKLKPNFIEAKYNYALVLTKKEQLQDAIDVLEPIVTEYPNFSSALGQLGELYLQTDDHKRALKVLDRRAELDPENPEAIHSLAQALTLTGHLEEAIQYYEKTLMLEPKHAEANHNLANAYVKFGDSEKAMNYYFRQISVAALPESYFNIGVLMMYKERNKEAIEYFEHAISQDPNNINTYMNLGSIHLKQQNFTKAIENYEAALKINPDNNEVKYIIDALKNESSPDRAPDEYLENLFDQYADYYDEHLTKYLEYSVPQKLATLLCDELGSTQEQWNIIDLGCGTGLSGQAFTSFAKELVGIDLSERMIESAKQKQIYQKLIIGEIDKELRQFDNIDLILAADVFSYIGDLAPIFATSSNALKINGLLLFSVERSTTGTYKLQQNMRYVHSKDYIESLSNQNHFELIRCNNTVLRKQQKQPVEGFLVLLKKIK